MNIIDASSQVSSGAFTGCAYQSSLLSISTGLIYTIGGMAYSLSEYDLNDVWSLSIATSNYNIIVILTSPITTWFLTDTFLDTVTALTINGGSFPVRDAHTTILDESTGTSFTVGGQNVAMTIYYSDVWTLSFFSKLPYYNYYHLLVY